jgi:creatinine amidohydrolase/Fe(II)-dependent formamide hydrolase-like protein
LRAVPLSSRSPIGVIGDAATASAEKGERPLEAISGDIAEALLNERLRAEPI